MRKKHFSKLRWEWIIGYIDHNDVVHSEKFHFEDDSKMHQDLFGKKLRNWRWNFDKSTQGSIRTTLEDGDWERIQDHLTKKYGIQWYSNGHHDIQHFIRKMKEEENEESIY